MRRLREEYGVFFIDDEFDAFLTNMAREPRSGIRVHVSQLAPERATYSAVFIRIQLYLL